MTQLSRITVYPIKSLDGHDVQSATLLERGPLVGDRQLRIVNEAGETVATRKEHRLTAIRCKFNSQLTRITLQSVDETREFDLDAANSELADWLSSFLGYSVRLDEDRQFGFPDDVEAGGPTLVSIGTITQLVAWFPSLDAEEIYRRLRPNLLVDAQEPFWEERLIGESCPGRFRIGQAAMLGERVCQRCVVPSLDSRSGAPTQHFAKQFSARREQHFPATSPRARFDHFYRACINTNVDTSGDGSYSITLGDGVRILDTDTAAE